MARCLTPFRNEEGMELPCGKCYECRARRVSSWSFRLQQELRRANSANFVTLTYDEETVPYRDIYQSLDKTDVQNFMKRLRKRNAKGIKYYLCGEYGGKTHRPHYHLILFNAKQETIEPAWKEGFVHIGQVTEASIVYTLKYIQKGGRLPEWEGDPRQKEFQHISKGLGDNYLSDKVICWHRGDPKNRLCIRLPDGKMISMPRYYRDRIFNKEEVQEIVIHMIDRETERVSALSVEQWFDEMTQIDLVRKHKQRKHGKNTGSDRI